MEQVVAKRWSIATFGLTILVSAFLLFQVQPLISKAILPWFGGCPAVWTTCMLFFQVVLFAGYMYAHLLQQWLPPKRQVVFHLVLVVAAAAILPIAPSDSWKPSATSNPTWQILLLLLATVGLPYFALSATSPLVQAWFSRAWPDRSPYRLYALSNIGSLTALLSYPFVFEPAFNLRTQSTLWSVAFVLYAFLCAATLVALRRTISPLPKGEGTSNASASPTWFDRLRWLALPACASLVLLATTNHVCQDVAVVPFLWVTPLALYLLSFIITFDHARWYIRRLWAFVAVVALFGSVSNDFNQLANSLSPPMNLPQQLLLYLGGMFCICMVCHGELARLKPSPRHLTEFYLLIAAGGAIGGLFVAIVAPLIFSAYFEWQISVAASTALCVGLIVLPKWDMSDIFGITQAADSETPKASAKPSSRKRAKQNAPAVAVQAGKYRPLPVLSAAIRYGLFLVGAVAIVYYLVFWTYAVHSTLDHARNFFGVVSVCPRYYEGLGKETLLLKNGRITHGCQFVDPADRRCPTTYYGEQSGVGKAIAWLQKRQPTIRVGAIGLGAGTLATYARPGDLFRFYEINPQVEQMARKHFTFLADCRGTVDVVLGDARLSLESETQKFDLLVLDAFSGDAIPTHLMTQEAFAVYEQRLAPGGVIAAHVSNNYLRLTPVVRRLAEDCDMGVSRIWDAGNTRRLQSDSTWVLATRNAELIEAIPSAPPDWGDDAGPAPLWTDQYSNLFQILKYR